MKNGVRLSFLLMIGLLAVSVPVVAHHGNASYGHAKQLTLKGTVTEWDWLSPHTLLRIDVKDESGNVVNRMECALESHQPWSNQEDIQTGR
jgi:hypothetical protein